MFVSCTFTDSVRLLLERYCRKTPCTLIPQITLEISFLCVCVWKRTFARALILIVFFICAINTLLSCQIVKLMTESAMILFVICFKLPYPSSRELPPFSVYLSHFVIHISSHPRGKFVHSPPLCLSVCLSDCMYVQVSEWVKKCKTKQLSTHRISLTILHSRKTFCAKEFISLFFSCACMCGCLRECVKVSHAHSIYCRKLPHSSIQTMQRTNCHCDINLSSFWSHGISNPTHWKTVKPIATECA